MTTRAQMFPPDTLNARMAVHSKKPVSENMPTSVIMPKRNTMVSKSIHSTTCMSHLVRPEFHHLNVMKRRECTFSNEGRASAMLRKASAQKEPTRAAIARWTSSNMMSTYTAMRMRMPKNTCAFTMRSHQRKDREGGNQSSVLHKNLTSPEECTRSGERWASSCWSGSQDGALRISFVSRPTPKTCACAPRYLRFLFDLHVRSAQEYPRLIHSWAYRWEP